MATQTLAQINLETIRAAYLSDDHDVVDALEQAANETGGQIENDWGEGTTCVVYEDHSYVICHGVQVDHDQMDDDNAASAEVAS